MATPKVNVLLSAYNGEKYIEKQLQSLFSQDYPNMDIYVRDDGSTDHTVQILKTYEKQGRIHLIKGKNLGFCASFFELLKATPEGDFWSFCDQDDIWKKEKISRAVKRLQKQGDLDIKPCLYYSCSQMIDVQGNDLGIQKPDKGSVCFRRALTGTFGVGFSMVINRPIRDAMLRCDAQKVHAHDWLAGAIALGLGRVIIDERISAYYRRLDVSVSRVTFTRRIKWFFQMLTQQGDVRERNLEFSRCFYKELPEKYRRYMDLFNKEHYSLRAALVKCLYPGRWRPSLGSEAAMRLLMVLGRV